MRERQKSFIHWFTPEMVTAVVLGQTKAWSVPWIHHVGSGPSSAAFPGILAGGWIGSRTAGTRTSADMGCWGHRQWLNSLCESAGSQI